MDFRETGRSMLGIIVFLSPRVSCFGASAPLEPGYGEIAHVESATRGTIAASAGNPLLQGLSNEV